MPTTSTTMILACSSLEEYVNAAQCKLGTNYPTTWLDKRLHADPQKMREAIQHALDEMPEEIHTVLVAMGYCGGSWKDIQSTKMIVRPHVDDCATLLLHTPTLSGFNLKQQGHLYMKDHDPKDFNLEKAFLGYTAKFDEATKAQIKQSWVNAYTDVDIVDTGHTDCHSPEYKQMAQMNADWIEGKVNVVHGSNIVIERLLAGDWSTGFRIMNPRNEQE